MGLERYMVDHRGSPRLALHVLVICKSKTAPHPVICPCKLVIHIIKMPMTAEQHKIMIFVCSNKKGKLVSVVRTVYLNPSCH